MLLDLIDYPPVDHDPNDLCLLGRCNTTGLYKVEYPRYLSRYEPTPRGIYYITPECAERLSLYFRLMR